MEFIEKTVFMSYRRANVPWALAISHYLTHLGYDVFFDYWSINSGDFKKIITENIRWRAHFLILLTPSTLKRCNEPNDWIRYEIESALKHKRNIVPIFLDGFKFDDKEITEYLTGNIENIKKLAGLSIFDEYFNDGMNKLCNQFLNTPLNSVPHPEMNKMPTKI